MRKRAVVKHINLWPLQEHRAATRDNLWPRGWCMTWLGDWVLGQIFCCLQRGLTRSPSGGRGGVGHVSADTAEHTGFVWESDHDSYRHTRHGFGWTPLTLFPCKHLGSTFRGPLRTMWNIIWHIAEEMVWAKQLNKYMSYTHGLMVALDLMPTQCSWLHNS